MLYEQEKWEKTLPDSSSPDRTRLSAPSLSKSRRKMSPFALQCEEKPPHHARRRPRGTLMALPVTGVGELGGGKEKGKTHTYTCTHTWIKKDTKHTIRSPHSWKTRCFSGLEKSMKWVLFNHFFLLSCSAQKYFISQTLCWGEKQQNWSPAN